MEAVERYTASHGGDSFDAILDWPATRFEAAYVAMLKRELEEELKNRKALMINAIWSNPNWDDEKANKQEAIAEIEENFEHSIRLIWEGEDEIDDVEEEDIDNNPFFAAAKRGMDKLDVPDLQDQDDTMRLGDTPGFLMPED
jgi:hypothetical protein